MDKGLFRVGACTRRTTLCIVENVLDVHLQSWGGNGDGLWGRRLSNVAARTRAIWLRVQCSSRVVMRLALVLRLPASLPLQPNALAIGRLAAYAIFRLPKYSKKCLPSCPASLVCQSPSA